MCACLRDRMYVHCCTYKNTVYASHETAKLFLFVSLCYSRCNFQFCFVTNCLKFYRKLFAYWRYSENFFRYVYFEISFHEHRKYLLNFWILHFAIKQCTYHFNSAIRAASHFYLILYVRKKYVIKYIKFINFYKRDYRYSQLKRYEFFIL